MSEQDQYLREKYKEVPTHKIKRNLNREASENKVEDEAELSRRLAFGRLAWIVSLNGEIEIIKETEDE